MTPQELFERADHEAATLGAEAATAELLAGTADAESGATLRADLLAHGMAASHRIMLRLCTVANDLLDWNRQARVEQANADTGKADVAAGRVAAVATRLMEQVRQGLVTLHRQRPEAAQEEEWVALTWADGVRCSDEELERRIARIKAARAAGQPQDRPLSERARTRRVAAREVAASLAEEARAHAIALVAADETMGVGFISRLFAHELGAAHMLMMRLAGATDRAIDRARERKEEPTDALALSGLVARLGDRYRRGMATLDRLGRGPNGGPGKRVIPVWGGAPGGYDPGDQSASAANDTAGHGVLPQDPSVRPAATAGHGVLRLVSSGPLPLRRRPRPTKTRHPGGLDRRAKAAG